MAQFKGTVSQELAHFKGTVSQELAQFKGTVSQGKLFSITSPRHFAKATRLIGGL